MTAPAARVVADSITPTGHRLTTMEVTTHRFVLAEFNTHRVLSKNSASSRAIPGSKQRRMVRESPAFPLVWASEQKGMQGGVEVDEPTVAKALWVKAMESAVAYAERLAEVGVHKSLTNRLTEPFAEHTIVVTGTAWENFFEQRCSPLAQPEIRAVADLMREAYKSSTPSLLGERDWHLPYVDPREVDSAETAVKVSAARCARVSYLTQDGKRDVNADLSLYDRLVSADPPHWSPLEHVATPDAHNVQSRSYEFYSERAQRWQTVTTDHLPVVGNLLGWRSLRIEVEAEKGVTTYR